VLTQAIKDLNAQHRFRDPVYGFIKATDAEMKIIDTPVFQWLRRIHQLALTKYVYPGAEHSHFVHSDITCRFPSIAPGADTISRLKSLLKKIVRSDTVLLEK